MRHIPYLAAVVLFLPLVLAGAAEPDRARADRLYAENNFKEAYEVYRALLLAEEYPGGKADHDLRHAVACLQRLNRIHEVDSLLVDTVERHGDDWRVLQAIGTRWMQIPHHGFVIAGEFRRGHHRGGGAYANAFDRDRFRALRHMARGMELVDEKHRPGYLLAFADFMQRGAHGGAAWRLQHLTDLDELPPLDERGRHHFRRHSNRGAPVDADGAPVFHAVPESWEDAASDGERWRWLLAEAARSSSTHARQVAGRLAGFAHFQFGVQTMQQYRYGHALFDMDEDAEDGPWSVWTLAEDETIARTAGGVQRFELPEDFDFVAIYRAQENWSTLGRIFENRGQYPKAAEMWRRAGRNHRDRLSQIVGNWGAFETVDTQPAGPGAEIPFRFRNGERLSITARRIDVSALLAATRDYLRDRSGKLDWNRMRVDRLGDVIVNHGRDEFVGEEVASWDVDLEPAPDHFARRTSIEVPIEEAGAYLIEGRMADGNLSRIVLWLADTALVSKRIEGKPWYLVADARSGEPIPGATVSFFGFRQNRVGRNRFEVLTSEFAERSDADGMVRVDPALVPDDGQRYRWLVAATTDEGRLAYLGYQGLWFGKSHHDRYLQTKAYFVTDRPVYRPGQTVNFKAWIRRARYDHGATSDWAGKPFRIKIANPRNETVFDETVTADDYAGAVATFELGEEATLGVYRVWIDNQSVSRNGGTFRVEEYRKPEFEVAVEAPEKPIVLGEKFTATIRADYYFGSPVTRAKVAYKVHRNTVDEVWYPPMPWDWLYGPGYWWYAEDWEWYPGWRAWGCHAPSPWWWWRRPDPPELVIENEVPIGPDGTVEVEIDTALAKELFADRDHRYTITAEVVDDSRRTIVGEGTVTAAREPYDVTAWVDRGYYRKGDTLRASFAGRTVDGAPVEGDGTLTLYAIGYRTDAPPEETEVARWDLDTGPDGRAEKQLVAGEAGQYRLSYVLADGHGHEIEGGYVFTVTGTADPDRGFRFDDLELIPDKAEYGPGDTAEILVGTRHEDATVLVFVKPSGGVYPAPRILRLDGRRATIDVDIVLDDMPNCYVEAITIAGGKVHTAVRELVVPPADRVLDVAVEPAKETCRPGEETEVAIRLTDEHGDPFVGQTVVSIYDEAVEYISGGSNVPDIREHFWKWRRRHHPHTWHDLARRGWNVLRPGEPRMGWIGIFDRFFTDSGLVDADGEVGAKGGGRGGARREERAADKTEGAMAAAPVDALGAAADDGAANAGGADLVEPTVRSEFADTALWAGAVETDADGRAILDLTLPENLTTWKVRVWAMGQGTRVGQGETEVITRKDLIVRLQAPRFFVEGDRVVLSANVHNYLDAAKDVAVALELDGGALKLLDDAERSVRVAAGGETRVNWTVAARHQGEAVVRMKALTDEESDAVEMRFPVKVHGMLRTESLSLALRPEQATGRFAFAVPEERRPEQSRVEIRYSPSLAAAMVDALPYLANYPYKTTDTTVSRFVPTVITQRILREHGVDLAAVREKRTNLNAQEIGDPGERAAQWKIWDRNPVFSEEEVARMAKSNLAALTSMQLSDGGWGWFSGWGERSSAHTTATVVHGLQIARENGLALVPGVLEKGVAWLDRHQRDEIAKLRRGREENPERPYKRHADELDALVFAVLIESGVRNDEMQKYLYEDRGHLAVYALACFGLALHELEEVDRLAMVKRNIEQYLHQDDENQTAWLDTGDHWWYWYGSDNEAHAWYLKLLARTEPESAVASRLVKYLLNNRKHGVRWDSPRDTAYCVEALAEYLEASGEAAPDTTVTVSVDGEPRKEVAITADNLFTFDGTLLLTGDEVTAGEHVVEIAKTGTAPLYANAYVSNFTLEDRIAAAGLEVKVARRYYRLERKDREDLVEGSHGQALRTTREAYKRIPIEDLAEIASGELVEVELVIASKNDYEYIVIEDPKAAGFAPVDLRSGYVRDQLPAYRELRDDRVAFFVKRLARGEHSISYRVRSEVPGEYHALPTTIRAMYAPELRGNSDEFEVVVGEREE